MNKLPRDINKMATVLKNIQNIIDEDFDGNQESFANAIKRSASYVSKLLNGKATPNFTTIDAITTGLGYSSDWLIKSIPPKKLDKKPERSNLVLDISRYRSENSLLQTRVDQLDRELQQARRDIDELKSLLHRKAV